ncbi:kinase-like protein [Serendipita vermifera]|nr:kinase-like protein [Serendipita vermifera]
MKRWYRHGDAAAFFRAYGRGLESMEERMDLWRGVISGVDYLHNCDPVIIHGDLKLDNVLLDDRGIPLLCDFGLARLFVENGHSGLTTTSNHMGTARYLAPEFLHDGDNLPSTASDIYALGCIGLEVLERIKGRIPPAYPPKKLDLVTELAWNMLEGCWRVTPLERVSTRELLARIEQWTTIYREYNESLRDPPPNLPTKQNISETIVIYHSSLNGEQAGIRSSLCLVSGDLVKEITPPRETAMNQDSPSRNEPMSATSSRQVNPVNPSYSSSAKKGTSNTRITGPRGSSQDAHAAFPLLEPQSSRSGKPQSTKGLARHSRDHQIDDRDSSEYQIPFIPPIERNTEELQVTQSNVIQENTTNKQLSEKDLLRYPPSQRVFLQAQVREKTINGSDGSEINSSIATSGSERHPRSFIRSFRRPHRGSSFSSSSRSAISSPGP